MKEPRYYMESYIEQRDRSRPPAWKIYDGRLGSSTEVAVIFDPVIAAQIVSLLNS